MKTKENKAEDEREDEDEKPFAKPDEKPEGDEGEPKDEESEEEERGDDALARDLISEAEELGCSVDEIAQVTDRDPAVIEAIKSGEISDVPDDLLDDLRQLVASKREDEDSEEREDEEEEERGLAAARRAFVKSAPRALRDLAEDVYLEQPRRSLTKVWRDVMEIAPSWAKADAAEMIRANPRAKLDDHRRALLELRAKRMAPVGSGPSQDETPAKGTQSHQQREDPQDFSGLF